MTVEPSINELVRYANELIQRGSLEKFINYEYFGMPCGCMGPQDGYSVCYCELDYLVHKHKVQILAKINEAEALNLMRKRIISALAG